MGVYFFYGEEDYLIDIELKKYRDKLDKSFSDMNYKVYGKLPYPDLISVLRTSGTMFGKIMIVINCFEMLSENYEDKQIEEISEFLKNNSEAVDIFFVARYLSDDKRKKPDSRRKIFKLLSQFNKQEFASIPTYKTAELSKIIVNMAKSKGISLENEAISVLIDNLGNNLRGFDMELDKLQLLAYPQTHVNAKMIEEITVGNQDLFKLTDYITEGKKEKALIELRRLLTKKHPLELLAPVQTILKKRIYLKLNSKTMDFKQLGQKTGLHEYVVKKTLEAMKNVKPAVLVHLRENLARAEYKIKSGLAYNLAEELENAIIG